MDILNLIYGYPKMDSHNYFLLAAAGQHSSPELCIANKTKSSTDHMAISLHMERKSPGYETYHCDLYLFRYINASY